MLTRFLAPLLLIAAVSSVTLADPPATQPTTRPSEWAVPIADAPGLHNVHKVTDNLYRGAQPRDDKGFAKLKKMGIKTVVNLRTFHSDRDECAKADLDYVHINQNAWHAEDEDAVEFLKVVTDPARYPIFVHCQHGSDRTGTMLAVYRIVVQGWSNEDAAREMTDGGYGFHPTWKNLVKYVRKVDAQRLRRLAELDGKPAATQPSTK